MWPPAPAAQLRPRAVVLAAVSRVYSTLDGSNFDNINMDVVAYGTGTYTGNCRYYVLVEAGI